MKRLVFVLALVSCALYSFTLTTSTWTLDKAHSKLGFSISHLTVSEIEGSFKMTEATITSSKEDFSDASVYMVADVNTVNTDNADRDAHLKQPDFFDAAKYPTIVFKSTSFTKADEKTYKVKGDLTMHGVTKPVELDAIAKIGTHPMNKKTIAGFKITGVINRSDFGIAASTPAAMLGDEVSIVANAEFVKN